ncbi:hypothetical protein [Cystobacter fuscus]|uniref:hypothetical protein n=1 Tax=Cystobacter fuscus TaxID=43 RepID=UPI002B2AD1F2|nr:hypothetical protein F0U63_31700 [Cystobacter fuscus]
MSRFITHIVGLNLLFTLVMVLLFLPLEWLSLPARRKLAHDVGSTRKRWFVAMFRATCTVAFILFVARGVTVAAAVRSSSSARPDDWWPSWYLLGVVGAIPTFFFFDHLIDEHHARVARWPCCVGAIGGYGLACLCPEVVPALLLRLSEILAV